jgi:hypothetical protein
MTARMRPAVRNAPANGVARIRSSPPKSPRVVAPVATGRGQDTSIWMTARRRHEWAACGNANSRTTSSIQRISQSLSSGAGFLPWVLGSPRENRRSPMSHMRTVMRHSALLIARSAQAVSSSAITTSGRRRSTRVRPHLTVRMVNEPLGSSCRSLWESLTEVHLPSLDSTNSSMRSERTYP